ncbi:MAG: YkgJ family cysteine cluster protein [Desulfobacterales bacterium]
MNPSDIFKCTQCGDCCYGYGGTFVSEVDIQTIAAYVGFDPEYFAEAYCQKSGNRLVLGQGPNGYCIFWDGICKIHPVKPRFCNQWPFIGSILVDVDNWYIMAGFCPGMRTNVSDGDIKACVEYALLHQPPIN